MQTLFENLEIILTGNFITACYTNNWSWSQLLKKPRSIDTQVQSNNTVAFLAPSWWPERELIVQINDDKLACRLSDLVYQKEETTKGSDKIIRLKFIYLKTKIERLTLHYWPFYVLPNKPFHPEITSSVLDYLAAAIPNVQIEEKFKIQSFSNQEIIFSNKYWKLGFQGTKELNRIFWANDQSHFNYFSIENKELFISSTLNQNPTFLALESILKNSEKLKDCTLNMNSQGIILRHEKND